MILPNKKIQEDNYVNLTDYSKKCPSWLKNFFVFVYFEDDSCCHLSNIFSDNMKEALKIVMKRFADCSMFIKNISIHESEPIHIAAQRSYPTRD